MHLLALLRSVFGKNRKKYAAIKLYSVGADQNGINREGLVESILGVFEQQFHELPENYDISGPYGIRKGSSVRLKTFRSKLEKIGHEKYYSYRGFTEGRLGFDILFDAKLDDSTSYTELIIWYDTNFCGIDFKELASKIIEPLSASSGYQIYIDDGIYIPTETKIKRSFLGSISIKVSYEHKTWLLGLNNGVYRALYEHNLWNKSQFEKALSQNLKIRCTPIGRLYYVEQQR